MTQAFDTVVEGLKRMASDRRLLLTLIGVLSATMLALCAIVLILVMDGRDASNTEVPDRPSDKTVEKLRALGYVGLVATSAEERAKVGVVAHVSEKTHPGLNLYNPCGWGPRFRARGEPPLREARLIDMDGKVLHRWRSDYLEEITDSGWAITKLSKDGYLYVVFANTALFKLDWQSNLVWGLKALAFHHDLDFADNGDIYVLLKRRREVEHRGEAFSILDDGYAIISPDGEVKEKHFLFDALQSAIGDEPSFNAYLDSRRSRQGHIGEDILHFNTVEILKKGIEGLWREGDIMTVSREMNLVFVFDQDDDHLVWTWGYGQLDRPHDPSLLENGNLLVFDNGSSRNRSRVIELDPKTRKIVWTYHGSEENRFFSVMRGLAQRLPNGNTLITSSHQSRAFEVTENGEIVWEYYSNDFKDDFRIPMRLIRLAENSLDELAKPIHQAPQ